MSREEFSELPKVQRRSEQKNLWLGVGPGDQGSTNIGSKIHTESGIEVGTQVIDVGRISDI